MTLIFSIEITNMVVIIIYFDIRKVGRFIRCVAKSFIKRKEIVTPN
jgi:hypothetical protein